LASLGLSQYAQRFAESDIDASILRDLTDRDLKGHPDFAWLSPQAAPRHS
jgi:hypothetical protein